MFDFFGDEEEDTGEFGNLNGAGEIERLLAAVHRAVSGIPGLELCEVNRTDEIPEGTSSTVLIYAGDPQFDAEAVFGEVERQVAWQMVVPIEFYCEVEGSRADLLRRVTRLWRAVVRACRQSAEIRLLVDGFGPGEGPITHPPEAGERAAQAVSLLLVFGMQFDPSNP